MKKLLVLLLALSVFGVFAFAQEAAPALTFSGQIENGIKVISSTDPLSSKKDTFFYAGYNDNDNPWAQSMSLVGAWNGTAIGGKFELVTGATWDVVTVGTAYTWWKPISMLTFQVGQNYGASYSTPIDGNVGDRSCGSGIGFVLAPISGLKFAVNYVPNTNDLLNNYGKGVGETTTATTKYAFELSYAINALLQTGIIYDLKADEIVFGVNYLGVAGLTAKADLLYWLDDNSTTSGAFEAKERVGYAFGSLVPSITAYETNKAKTDAWWIQPKVAYTINNLTPSASFKYAELGDWTANVSCAVSVEKQTVNFYFDYISDATKDKDTITYWDIGVNTKIAF